MKLYVAGTVTPSARETVVRHLSAQNNVVLLEPTGGLGAVAATVADHAEGVVVLPGWQRNRRARIATFTAFLSGLPIFYLTMRRVPQSSLVAAWAGRTH